MEAGGHLWRLGVFPGGHSKSNASDEEKESAKASVRVDLDYFGKSYSVKAKYTVTLVNHLPGGGQVLQLLCHLRQATRRGEEDRAMSRLE